MPLLPRALTHLHHPRLAGLLVTTVALGLAFSFVAPFLSLWGTTRVGLSPVQFSAFMTAVTLSAIVLSTWMGRWSDTGLSRRAILLLGSGAGAVGYAGYATLQNPWALAGVGVTCVAMASVCFSQLFAHVRETYAGPSSAGRRSTMVVSIVRVCFSVAWTGGPALAALVLAGFGFPGLFLTAAGLYLLFFAGVWRFVPGEAPAGAIPRSELARESVWQALRNRDLFVSFLAFAAVFAAFAMNLMNLPLFVTRGLGGSERDLGITFCVGPVVEIPLMLWFGYLAARGRLLRLIQVGMTSSALYFLALLLASTPWHVYFVQAISGLCFAVLTNVGILYFQDLMPRRVGLATAVFSNAANAGNLLGFFAFGGMLERFGHHGVQFAGALLAALALALLLLLSPRSSS